MKRIVTLTAATMMAFMVTAAPASGVVTRERPATWAADTSTATHPKENGLYARCEQKSDGPKFLGIAWEASRKDAYGIQKGGLVKEPTVLKW